MSQPLVRLAELLLQQLLALSALVLVFALLVHSLRPLLVLLSARPPSALLQSPLCLQWHQVFQPVLPHLPLLNRLVLSLPHQCSLSHHLLLRAQAHQLRPLEQHLLLQHKSLVPPSVLQLQLPSRRLLQRAEACH